MLRGKRGYSLFEQALVLPALVILAVGAIDLTGVLQTYTALRQGVKTSLRCLYTVDGACVETSADSRERFYNLFSVKSPAIFPVRMFNYSLEASWLEVPYLTYDSASARILDRVFYDTSGTQIRADHTAYPILVPATVRTALFPFVTGTSSRNAEFVYKGNPERSYPTSAVINISDRRISSTNETEDIPILIPLPAGLNPSIPCYDSIRINEPDGVHHADPSRSCHKSIELATGQPTNKIRGIDTYMENTTTDYFVFHIKGIGSAHGNTSLSLLSDPKPGSCTREGNQCLLAGSGRCIKEDSACRFEPDYATILPLGGQDFTVSAGEAANYSARGPARIYVNQDFWDDHSEYRRHDFIILQYGKEYKLRMHWDSGGGWWQGTVINVYGPQYTTAPERVACVNSITKSQYEKNSGNLSCQVPDHGLLPVEASGSLTVNTGANVSTVSPVALGCYESLQAAEELLKTKSPTALKTIGFQDTDLGNYTLKTGNSCAATGLSKSCGSNYGVPAAERGADGRVRGSSTALSACAPPAHAVPNSISWSTNEKNLPVPGTFRWLPQDCNQKLSADFTLPNDWSSYKDLTLGATVPVSDRTSEPLFTGDQSLPQYLEANPNLNCPNFIKRACAIYDGKSDMAENLDSGGCTTIRVEESSLLAGETAELAPACSREELKQAAIAGGMDANTYFDVNARYTGEETLANKPGGTCVAYGIDYRNSSEKEFIGEFSVGNFPPDCESGTVLCAAQFSRFGEGESGSTSYDFETAVKRWGIKEIQAALPRARTDCQGKYCLDMSVERQGIQVLSRAAMEVPLTFPITLALGETITLRYSGVERFESEFAK